MDDLIKMVTQRVGIPEDKARSAVEFIVAQLKSRLPAPLAGQIESALSGVGAGLISPKGGSASQSASQPRT